MDTDPDVTVMGTDTGMVMATVTDTIMITGTITMIINYR